MLKFDITEIQNYLDEQSLAGWLMYDFRGQNYIANAMLTMDPKRNN